MAEDLTDPQIDVLIDEGGKFLRTASSRPEIMTVLASLGYTDADHKEGFQLFLEVLGQMGVSASWSPTTPQAPQQIHAMATIDAYDEQAFRCARAGLERPFPAQAAYMFQGLQAQRGVASIGSVKGFIDRYVSLRDGTDPARSATRDEDKAAAALLEKRNIINPAKEKELRGLIEIAQQLAPAPGTKPIAPNEQAKQESAKKLKAWLGDWRATAAAGVPRKADRILLGVSQRRESKKTDGTEPTDAADTTE